MPSVPLGTQPTYLPARQHAWSQWLHRDEYGNPLAPRYDRLLFFDVRGRPTPAYARLLESRLRTLERHFRWGPDGLLFTVSYGPEYFTGVLGVPRTARPRDQPLELRVAGDRQLSRVHAPRLRRRDAAR